MSTNPSLGQSSFAAIPSLDRLLSLPVFEVAIEQYGRALVTGVARDVVAEFRNTITQRGDDALPGDVESYLFERALAQVEQTVEPSLKPVLNLTGTVIHTNLGRAPLPAEAVEAMTRVATGATNLEMNLDTGKRGDRDSHLEAWLCRLTGAEAATVVNNNAAAVLLTLNSLAARKEVPVSRGELIEIGGSFRMPDIMARAGCKLVEVGTTNRTHLADFRNAVGPRTALLMKVHTSNYVVQGFTASPEEAALAKLAHEHGLPFVNDLGSGSLIDLTRFGLPHESTPMEAIADGADVVTFSGDKLLGGPQCGLIVGSKEYIAKIKRNPMKRAMRIDKITIAALSAVLRLYADPERVAARVPVLRLLTRPADEIEASARRVAPALQARLGDVATVEVEACMSQIGSGALPVDALPSAGLAVRPNAPKKNRGRVLKSLSAAFRRLPVPVVGYVHDDALRFDLRRLEDETLFTGQLERLDI